MLLKKLAGSISKFKIIITNLQFLLQQEMKLKKLFQKKYNLKKLISVVSNPEFLREGEGYKRF